MSSELPSGSRWISIPPVFQSLYHEGPFPKCADCDCDLLNSNKLYLIDRTFRGTEPIYEYAICLDCRQKLTQDLSKESVQRITAWQEERFDPMARLEKVQLWDEEHIDSWLGECVFTKAPKDDCRGHQILALCQGSNMSIDMLPIMISAEASDEAQKLLSKSTRDRLEDFSNDIFDHPPEFADGPSDPAPLLL